MSVFLAACMIVIVLALLSDTRSGKGILVVPRWVWSIVLALLAVWLFVLEV